MDPDPHQGAGTPAYPPGRARACLTRISQQNPTIRIAEGGQLFELKTPEFHSIQEFGGRRNAINDFSADSRRRLQRKLASINEFACGLPDFLTLTYPGEYSLDWRMWKKHLNHFNVCLVRKWPKAWGLWRLEFQKRGAPHYHFLLWDGPQVEGMDVWMSGDGKPARWVTIAKPGYLSEHNEQIFTWISETWFRVVGSGDRRHLEAGTRVEPIQSWNGVRSYASKYLAKLPDGNFVPPGYEGTGRFWGVIGKARWKSTFFEHELPERVFFKIKRVLRKRLEKKGLNPWRMKLRGKADHGMSTFLNSVDAFKLLAWAWAENGNCPF